MVALLLRTARAKKTPRAERLKVAFFILERKFPIPRNPEPLDVHRPIAVQVNILGSASLQDPHPGLPPGSLTLCLGGDQPGNGGGVGGVRDEG